MVSEGNVERGNTWRHKFIHAVTPTKVGSRIYLHIVPPVDKRLMLWTKGRYAFSPGPALVLLTTKGAKTGQVRHTPVGAARKGDIVILIASNAGKSHHPNWYFNISANPELTITIHKGGSRRYRAEEI